MKNKSPINKPGKTPYHTPKVRTYGNINELTHAIMTMGDFDSGGGAGSRTAA